MREALLTVGMLLIFAGGMGAIAASTINTGPIVADPCNPAENELSGCFDSVIFGTMPKIVALFISEIVFTVIAFVGAALVLRNR